MKRIVKYESDSHPYYDSTPDYFVFIPTNNFIHNLTKNLITSQVVECTSFPNVM